MHHIHSHIHWCKCSTHFDELNPARCCHFSDLCERPLLPTGRSRLREVDRSEDSSYKHQAPSILQSLAKYWSICQTNQKNEGRKEGNVLFNNVLNTFYLQLYGIRHMVKDHSDSEKGNLLLPHRVLLYAPSHRQNSTYHSLCYTRRGALAGMRNSSMGPPHERSIRRPIAP